MTNEIRFLIGVDGGGTHCRAAIALPDGTELSRAISGPANIASDIEMARQNVVDAVQKAAVLADLEFSELASASAFLGLAGASSLDLSAAISQQLPFALTHVSTDAAIALQGALGDNDGAIAILGTGSSFLARKGNVLQLIGGWGSQLSDHGGGARLGRAALEAALLAHDGIIKQSAMTQDLIRHFSGSALAIGHFSRTAKPADFGDFAPMVIDHLGRADNNARLVFIQAANAIDAALDALHLQHRDQISLLGGLADYYPPYLAKRHTIRLVQPKADALTGAIALAAKLSRGDAPIRVARV